MFYTYAHFKPDDRVFYIGKGRGNRYLSTARSQYWKNIVAKAGGFKAEILANWSTEAEAFAHEKFLIKCFRDLGHNLCNMTDGGEGSSGVFIDAEARLQRSRTLLGRKKSTETRAKMSAYQLANTKAPEALSQLWVGRKHTPETREKMSKSRAAYLAAAKVIKPQIAEGATV